ncbi:MAG: exodeoxyribonuclease VII large subunit [Deferribacteres bacterium]|nr:exodeoxyribonuclease VII large subunit [candidate division KSB1 bacterium]MCB9501496.1 exodeoxyribonuclease VII large subunit [Deferribacteres bacterium]
MNDFEDYLIDGTYECLTVSDATQRIKSLLETELLPMEIEGEISNFLHHNSGHMYFSIKDAKAQMPCVMWSGRNVSLRFKPSDGLKVRVQGRITVYERRGAYQLEVYSMRPSGVGPLQEAFERLKQELNEQGLFDEAHKLPIPAIPSKIGIVTSETGAAIRDIVSVIRRRWPVAELILRPTLVQGETAAQDIAEAIAEFNEFGDVDVLIVGRGGGSLEDLWAFNEEIVARAIYKSMIPVVSAVGHQIDFTISDFVADLRAPTPSAAGELVVPDAFEVRNQMHNFLQHALRQVESRIRQGRQRLDGLIKSYGLRKPFDELKQLRQTLDEMQMHLAFLVKTKIIIERQNVVSFSRQLDSLNHKNILKRGFSIVRDKASKNIIKTTDQLLLDQEIEIKFAHGSGESKITQIHTE